MNDPKAFVAAANRRLAEPGLRDWLGAAARGRAYREFGHPVMAVRTREVYEDLFGGGGPEIRAIDAASAGAAT